MVRTVLPPDDSAASPPVDTSAARLQPRRAGHPRHPSAPSPRSLTLCVDPRRPPRPRPRSPEDPRTNPRRSGTREATDRPSTASGRLGSATSSHPTSAVPGRARAHPRRRAAVGPPRVVERSSEPRRRPGCPVRPLPRAVHTFPHCGALVCGYRPQRATDCAHCRGNPHSYTACGWSCPQSSTGFLWVFTSAECVRPRWTTGAYLSGQIPTRSGFSPRNLWTGQFVHTLWTAPPCPVCAQFCGQLWMKVLSVWTGHPRSVDDVWGQIVRPQGLRLSHTGRTGSSTRVCAR
ncbi:hypothetical protein SAMN04487781_0689 [Cellulosimicrobium cellulans]|nr:hypothetical protein SAMN04487781_0689 [Cellulosimicrobium cellulans]